MILPIHIVKLIVINKVSITHILIVVSVLLIYFITTQSPIIVDILIIF